MLRAGGLRVPDERLLGDGARLLVRVGAVHHRERRRGLVAELADGLGAVGLALAVVREALLELLGRVADGERQQADAALADLVVAVDARRRAPDRRVRILQRLRVHAPLRHRPVLALELVLVVGPAADDVAERLVPHLARLVRVDAEAFDLGARRRAAGAELDATVADEVEHRDALGGADRMVVRLGQQPHAVADAQVLGDRGDVPVQHLGVRAVRVLVEEVVLDGPERVEAHAVAELHLLDRVLVRLVLRPRVPRLRHRNLVEHRELHGHDATVSDTGRAAQSRGDSACDRSGRWEEMPRFPQFVVLATSACVVASCSGGSDRRSARTKATITPTGTRSSMTFSRDRMTPR